MKKVCMIVPSFEAKGGITSVVSGYRGSDLEKNFQIRYIETYCDGEKAKKLWKAICAYALFLWTLISFHPDLIHIHSSFGASFYRKAPFVYIGSALRIPVVNHIHGSELEQFYQNASPLQKRFKRNTFHRCSKIIALSDQWKTRFAQLADVDKIEVLGNYSQIIKHNAFEESKDAPKVLFLGFLSELKGCFDIPKVAALVRKSVQDVQFILAGTGSDRDIQYLWQLSRKYDLADTFFLPGWVKGEQKENFLKTASVFFLPSYTEGMPVSILEAMGYGLPVVSTTVGGIPQLVKHGETGYLVEPGDTEGFAQAIISLLEEPKKRTEMGRAGLAFVQEHYSFEKHINSLIAVYERVIGG